MNKYPNLNELAKYHPYGKPAMCAHAQIEPELLQAVLNGEEALTPVEITGLSRLYGCPAGVLNCPKVIMLDMDRWRHKKIAAQVDALYMQLKWMAKTGNAKAEKYLEWAERKYQRFARAAVMNNLSYGHYLGVKEQMGQYVSFAAPEPKRRGLKERNTVCR